MSPGPAGSNRSGGVPAKPTTFAHALDDGQAEYADAAGGDVEALHQRLVVLEAERDALAAAVDRVRRRHPRGDEESGYLAPGLWCPTCGHERKDNGYGGCPDRNALIIPGQPLTTQRTRTAAAIRAEADRICAQRGCHVAGNDHAELMKWAGVFAGVVERGVG